LGVRFNLSKWKFLLLCAFFWVIPRCLQFKCQHFETLSVPS
jgi:hypothetical protein